MNRCMKEKHLTPTIRRILSYLLPYKREFLFIGLTLFISIGIGFFQPLVIRAITDDGMLQQNMEVIVHSALALAGLVLVNQAIDLWQTRIFADVHNKSYYMIFHQVFEKILHLKKTILRTRTTQKS